MARLFTEVELSEFVQKGVIKLPLRLEEATLVELQDGFDAHTSSDAERRGEVVTMAKDNGGKFLFPLFQQVDRFVQQIFGPRYYGGISCALSTWGKGLERSDELLEVHVDHLAEIYRPTLGYPIYEIAIIVLMTDNIEGANANYFYIPSSHFAIAEFFRAGIEMGVLTSEFAKYLHTETEAYYRILEGFPREPLTGVRGEVYFANSRVVHEVRPWTGNALSSRLYAMIRPTEPIGGDEAIVDPWASCLGLRRFIDIL